MAALASIVLADAQVSPVNHTFAPSRKWVDPTTKFSYLEYLDTSVNGGVPQLANKILLGSKVTNLGGKYASDWQKTCTAQVLVPVAETLGNNTVSGINPQPSKAYDIPFMAKLIRPGRSSKASAQDLRKFAYLLLQQAQFAEMFDDLVDPI